MAGVKYNSREAYLADVPADRQEAFTRLIDLFDEQVPSDFERCMQYNMPAWNVSLDTYPNGYHCTPNTPLPFLNLANRKGYLAIYHMGIYADPDLLAWWKDAYPQHARYKLDMGKSCIRLKRMDDIPYDLIAELATKMTAQDWIDRYEASIKK